jgi:hypothetical protein
MGGVVGRERDQRGDLAALPARFIGTSLSIVARSNVGGHATMMPGATAFTVTPRLASSSASDGRAVDRALGGGVLTWPRLPVGAAIDGR